MPDNYLAEEAVQVARKNGYKEIGCSYQNMLPAAFYLYLKNNLSGVEIIDFSDPLDHIKAVKSEYELNLWGRVVEIHDELMAAIPALMRSGRTEREVTNDIYSLALGYDCECFNIMMGSDPKMPLLNQHFYQK
jgi:Xaa-Pro aminopeptidase